MAKGVAQMEQNALLSDVDIKTVTLKQLVSFIEEMKKEYPVAIRVLAKRLLENELGVKNEPIETDFQILNDDRIIESLHHLESDMKGQAKNESIGIFVLSLNSTFGFGKKRILRLWGEAKDMFDGHSPTVDELIKWCDKRGIDYDDTFGIQAAKKDIPID